VHFFTKRLRLEVEMGIPPALHWGCWVSEGYCDVYSV